MCVMNAMVNHCRERRWKVAAETYEWLTAEGPGGVRRIERLSWRRLARIYHASAPGSKVRKAIQAECRRLGYTPRVILELNK